MAFYKRTTHKGKVLEVGTRCSSDKSFYRNIVKKSSPKSALSVRIHGVIIPTSLKSHANTTWDVVMHDTLISRF
ncbi:14341_t:CDS:2 [Acaulospora colombiana]|uniref:14341_t:CDS:1 n=1 Tax=Acaulospora colombiana TaxID=27376 RepID=A0ACA9JVN4_9GLOM|nr:14341_t:CDS:2 [Acaulospora colombiana]